VGLHRANVLREGIVGYLPGRHDLHDERVLTATLVLTV